MDQIRKALSWLKQNHFWVLSGLIALIGLFCWWSAAGSLTKQYEANKSKIMAEFSSMQSEKSKPFHPNEEINKRQVEETNLLSAEVFELWQKLYEAQGENVLVWPAALSTAFRDAVDKLEFGAAIPSNLRENYQNYITRHFTKLPEKIGARPLEESSSTSAGGEFSFSRLGGGSMTPGELDDDYICVWDPANQSEVRADLEFLQQPSSIRIWVTQENLWVYTALLDVIKNTNEAAGATRMSNAAVRVVHLLEVGKRAAPNSRTPNRVYKPPTAVASVDPDFSVEPGPGGMERGIEGVDPFGGMESGGPTGGPMTEAQEAAVLLTGRYLGEDGKPIQAAPAGGDAGGDGATPAPTIIDMTAYGKEYRRLPVRMVLEMDQRHLPKLISECAIQPLQIEVQEVRVNPPTGVGGGSGGGSMGSEMGFMSSGGGRFGGGEMGLGGGGTSLFPDTGGLDEFKSQPQVVTVVIQGVIYIFSKPNAESLKAGEGTDEAPATDSV